MGNPGVERTEAIPFAPLSLPDLLYDIIRHQEKPSQMDEIVPGIYEHYKGRKYLVIGTAAHSETLDRLVVYISLYDSPGPRLWVRPREMFAETVEIEGKVVPRFRYIGQEIPSE